MSFARASVLTALLFGGVTLGTFGAMQDYGPASAVRRFHLAVEKRDFKEASTTLTESLRDPDSLALASLVSGLVQGGRPYRIARMERLPREVRAVVIYEGGGLSRAFVWVVVKSGRTWKIDVRRTATILRDALGGGGP